MKVRNTSIMQEQHTRKSKGVEMYRLEGRIVGWDGGDAATQVTTEWFTMVSNCLDPVDNFVVTNFKRIGAGMNGFTSLGGVDVFCCIRKTRYSIGGRLRKIRKGIFEGSTRLILSENMSGDIHVTRCIASFQRVELPGVVFVCLYASRPYNAGTAGGGRAVTSHS